MSSDYIIAIGGSGVRAAHALLHLCAAGLCDKDLQILVVDTDSEENGNTKELRALYDAYATLKRGADNLVKSGVKNPKHPLFGRKVEVTFGCSLVDEAKVKPKKILERNIDIGRALMTDNELDTDITTGLYGKPCVGALTFHKYMAKAILGSFYEKLLKDAVNGSVKLMFVGSAFGGTGATGLLLLRQHLRKKIVEQLPDDQKKAQEHICCAVTILAPYFVVAKDSDNIFCAHSHYERCAMALQHYEKVEKEYKEKEEDNGGYLPVDEKYLIGVPFNKQRPVRGEFASAGTAQKNWPHACDYAAAFAVVDFNANNSTVFQTKPAGWRYFKYATEYAPLFSHIPLFADFERLSSVFLNYYYERIQTIKADHPVGWCVSELTTQLRKQLKRPATWSEPWLTPQLRKQPELLSNLVFFLKDFQEWLMHCCTPHTNSDQQDEFLPPLLNATDAKKDFENIWTILNKECCESWNELLEVLRDPKKAEEGYSIGGIGNDKSHSLLPGENIEAFISDNSHTDNWVECGIPSLFDQVWRCMHANSTDTAMKQARLDLIMLLAAKDTDSYLDMGIRITIQRHFFWHQDPELRDLLAVDAPNSYHFGDKAGYCHASFWVIMLEYPGHGIPVGFLCPNTEVVVVPSKRFMELRNDASFKRKFLTDNNQAKDAFRKALQNYKGKGSQASPLLGTGQDWDPQAPPNSASPFELQYLEKIPEIPEILFTEKILYYEKDSENWLIGIPIQKKDSYDMHAWQALMKSVEIRYDEATQKFRVTACQFGKPEKKIFAFPTQVYQVQEKPYFDAHVVESIVLCRAKKNGKRRKTAGK